MQITWVRIRSWHAIRFESRGSLAKALCGKWAKPGAEIRDTLSSEKSCESCLRIVARSADGG